MEANELRTGNWYRTSQVDSFGEDIVYFEAQIKPKDFVSEILPGTCVIEHYDPIELTEEWLIKFGFYGKRFNNYVDKYTTPAMELIWSKTTMSVYIKLDGTQLDIKHVHQLQNLYFALTSEELTIKP